LRCKGLRGISCQRLTTDCVFCAGQPDISRPLSADLSGGLELLLSWVLLLMAFPPVFTRFCEDTKEDEKPMKTGIMRLFPAFPCLYRDVCSE
jgi:hypothetical protein